MNVNTNTWNKIRYTLYLPVYDLIGKLFSAQRKRSVQLAEIKPNEQVLLVGAGTGLDLEFLKGCENLTAIDITPGMISTLKKRADKLGMQVNAFVGDGHHLNFPNDSFDVVFLHLILAVIPDPVRCIQEVERVLKKGGRVMVLDKFLPDDQKPGLLRHIFNLIANLIASNINRKLGPILTSTNLSKEIDESGAFNGVFRIVKLKK